MHELPIGQVICADCLDFMKTLPDGCIDAVITDPPYGINIGATGQIGGNKPVAVRRKEGCPQGNVVLAKNYGVFEWDTKRPSADHFNELRRVSKVQAIFGGNYFADLLPPTACWICWDKGRRNNFADCELVWTSESSPARVLNYHYDGCMTAEPNRELPRAHPTQKPIPVMEWLINKFTQPGALILDCFCGSGSTLTAAERLGRRWIGIDISAEYCAIARKRTAQKGLDFMQQSQLAE